MNAQERAVIDGIFERLRNVANQPRDAEVERHIAELIRQQPYAPYAMAQSIYVQEQALLNQQQQIEQLQQENQRLQQQAQAAPQQQSGGFLSGLFGGGSQPQRPEPAYGQRNQPGQTTGPWGQPAQPPAPAPQAGPWGQPAAAQPPQQKQGMGFLGTAAAAAAGVAGGMVLGNILSSAFGGGSAHAAQPQGGQNFLGNQNHQQAAQGGPSPSEDPGYEDDGYDEAGDSGYDDGGDSYEA